MCNSTKTQTSQWFFILSSKVRNHICTIFNHQHYISAFTLPPSIDHKFNLWPFRTFHNTSSRLINSFSNEFICSSSIVFNACRLIWFVDPSCLKKLGSSCVCRGIKLLFSLLISTVCSAIRRIFFLIISYL